jgi:bifunctional UDP-N-acetylglucosamine pyrophosphorylase/glucosamine-1-phosphate N-acetyltransferase
MPGVPDDHQVLILYGDLPLIEPNTLSDLVRRAGEDGLALLSVHVR